MKKVKARNSTVNLIGKRKEARGTSQKDAFTHVYNTRPHYCTICLNYVDGRAVCFAHVLDKGQRPKYRAEPNNIALVCSKKCHEALDRLADGKSLEIEENLDDRRKIYKILTNKKAPY